jgi:hypothetical protein
VSVVVRWAGGEIECADHSDARATIKRRATQTSGAIQAVRISDGALLSFLPAARYIGAPRGAVTAAKISLATRDAERALTAEIRGLA